MDVVGKIPKMMISKVRGITPAGAEAASFTGGERNQEINNSSLH